MGLSLTKSSNPVLTRGFSADRVRSEPMTVDGTVNKSLIMATLLLVGAAFAWIQGGQSGNYGLWMAVGGIGGLICALITVFSRRAAPFTAPLYALLEGLALGAISGLVNRFYPDIVPLAVALTSGTLVCMLGLYRARVIRVSDKLRSGILMATGAVFFVYLLSWLLGLFGIGFPLIHGAGPVGILFSVVVVGIAAFNLLLDFDFIERGADEGLPKSMEWIGALGLMVTLVWLYIEILQLLLKLAVAFGED